MRRRLGCGPPPVGILGTTAGGGLDLIVPLTPGGHRWVAGQEARQVIIPIRVSPEPLADGRFDHLTGVIREMVHAIKKFGINLDRNFNFFPRGASTRSFGIHGHSLSSVDRSEMGWS